jgi:hypothetical protein
VPETGVRRLRCQRPVGGLWETEVSETEVREAEMSEAEGERG